MIKHSSKQSGSTHLIIIVILVIVLLGTLGFVFWKNYMDKKPVTKSSESSKTDTKSQPKDEYEGWKTYTNTRDGYSIKYPSDWLVIKETSSDGPYIRNFDPSSRPAEDPAHNKNYPKDYINLRVLKTAANDPIFMDSTAGEWYEKLGVSTVSNGPVTYAPDTVATFEVNGMAAKKTKSTFSETNEDIFLLKDGSLYNLNLYPYGISSDAAVKKILDSFSYL